MNERVKIVALHSGGLDSVVLMHHLKEKFPDAEVHTLFFDYGQNALLYEESCSKSVSDDLGYKWTKIKIEPSSVPIYNLSLYSFNIDGLMLDISQ